MYKTRCECGVRVYVEWLVETIRSLMDVKRTEIMSIRARFWKVVVIGW